MFLLSAQFLYYTFKVRKLLPLLGLSTGNQNKNYVSYNFLSSLLCLSMLTILWLQSPISRAKLRLLLTLNLWSDDFWCKLYVAASCTGLLKSLCYCCILKLLQTQMTMSFILFYGYDLLW